MEKYLEKANILTKYFGLYGHGNFDLTLKEIAIIIKLLASKKNNQYLENSLSKLYEKLETTRMG